MFTDLTPFHLQVYNAWKIVSGWNTYGENKLYLEKARDNCLEFLLNHGPNVAEEYLLGYAPLHTQLYYYLKFFHTEANNNLP